MSHQEWLQEIQNTIKNIKEKYPQSPLSERPVWQSELARLKKSCDSVLEAWVKIEEEVALLMHEYPELIEEEDQFDEEIWLPESVVRQFRQGQGYYGLTMFHEAKSLFGKVVEDEPDFILGRIYLGLSEFKENRLEEAAYHFKMVSKTGTKEMFVGFAQHMLGCIAVKREEDSQAVKHFSNTVELLPNNSDGWFNLGACQYRMGEYQKAIPHFYRALAINEDDWESMYYLSSCYRKNNEWGSVSYWRMASYEKANHPHIIESIAQDYEEMNQPHNAIEWYRRLLDADKQNPKAFHGIAWNFWVMNNSEEALSWIKRGLSLFPHDSNLLFTFVWICLCQGDLEKAECALGNLSDERLEDPAWIAVKSRLLTQMGNFKGATVMAEQLIHQQKNSVQALGYYQMGRVCLEQKKGTDAILNFQQASKLNPTWRDPIFFEGICHMMEGRMQDMINCWERIELT